MVKIEAKLSSMGLALPEAMKGTAWVSNKVEAGIAGIWNSRGDRTTHGPRRRPMKRLPAGKPGKSGFGPHDRGGLCGSSRYWRWAF